MCCLFGFYNYSNQSISNLSDLTNALAEQAIVRGTDASGIAYNDKNKLVIYKEPKPANHIDFRHSDSSVCVMGHTRHSTQGSCKKNYNNHPFLGRCRNLRFALAHNGVLINDHELRRTQNVKSTKIDTDSYIAVQLLEKKRFLNSVSIKFMAEKVEGSFAFSILDSNNTLWLIRGDSPLSLIHIPKYKLYVYASTSEILYKALVDTKLFDEIKKGAFDEIEINSGDILNLLPDGSIVCDKFNYSDYSCFSRCNWWESGLYSSDTNSYMDDLKSVAVHMGVSPDDIDTLAKNGFTPEEIEEYIYCL